MSYIAGKYEAKRAKKLDGLYFLLVPLSFFLIEVFGFDFLAIEEELDNRTYWQLAFGGFWAVIFSGIILILQRASSFKYAPCSTESTPASAAASTVSPPLA